MGWGRIIWDRVQQVVDREAAAIKRVQDVGLHGAARIAAGMLGERLPRARGELAPWQSRSLEALQSRLCRPDGDDLPTPEEAGAFEATRSYIEALPPDARDQLGFLIALVEVSPRVLGPERLRFTALSPSAQDEVLRAWAESALPPRRAVLGVLKGVCAVGYWSRPDTWAAIGYNPADNPGLPEALRQSLAQAAATPRA